MIGINAGPRVATGGLRSYHVCYRYHHPLPFLKPTGGLLYLERRGKHGDLEMQQLRQHDGTSFPAGNMSFLQEEMRIRGRYLLYTRVWRAGIAQHQPESLHRVLQAGQIGPRRHREGLFHARYDGRSGPLLPSFLSRSRTADTIALRFSSSQTEKAFFLPNDSRKQAAGIPGMEAAAGRLETPCPRPYSMFSHRKRGSFCSAVWMKERSGYEG